MHTQHLRSLLLPTMGSNTHSDRFVLHVAFCREGVGWGGEVKVYSIAAHNEVDEEKQNSGPESDKQASVGVEMRTTTLKLKHIYKCMMIMINRLKRYRCLRFMSSYTDVSEKEGEAKHESLDGG
jgi:hypothetical protein